MGMMKTITKIKIAAAVFSAGMGLGGLMLVGTVFGLAMSSSATNTTEDSHTYIPTVNVVQDQCESGTGVTVNGWKVVYKCNSNMGLTFDAGVHYIQHKAYSNIESDAGKIFTSESEWLADEANWPKDGVPVLSVCYIVGSCDVAGATHDCVAFHTTGDETPVNYYSNTACMGLSYENAYWIAKNVPIGSCVYGYTASGSAGWYRDLGGNRARGSEVGCMPDYSGANSSANKIWSGTNSDGTRDSKLTVADEPTWTKNTTYLRKMAKFATSENIEHKTKYMIVCDYDLARVIVLQKVGKSSSTAATNSNTGTNSNSTTSSGSITVGVAWRSDSSDSAYQAVKQVFTDLGCTVKELPQIKYSGSEVSYGDSGDVTGTNDNGSLSSSAGEAVRKNGSSDNVKSAIEGCDLIVLTGGEDISTSLMEHPPDNESSGSHNAARDVSDYCLAKYCLENNVQILGICRGCQMLTVAAGGSLVQDIGDAGFDDVGNHSGGDHYVPGDVTATSGSLLATLWGTTDIKGVPHIHHQAANPDDLGKVKICATSNSSEKVVEGVIYEANSLYLGVQFHPEAAYANLAEADGICSSSDAKTFFENLVSRVSGVSESVSENCEDTDKDDKNNAFDGDWVYYNQKDPNWDTSGDADGIDWGVGCGVVSEAMIVSSFLKDTQYTPSYFAAHGWSDGDAIWGSIPDELQSLMNAAGYEMSTDTSGADDWHGNWDEVVETCKNGGAVVVGQDHISSSTHFIVVKKVENGTVTYADPATGSEGTYPEDEFKNFGNNGMANTQTVWCKKK